MILPALAAAVVLAASPVRGDEMEDVISSLIRDTKNDAEAAAKLVSAAGLLKDAPAMQVAFCEKACDLGIKNVAGFESVAAALDLLDQVAPQRAEAWQQKRLTFYKRRYALVRKDKRKHGEALVKMLLQTGERHAARNEWGEAIGLYRQALPVAKTLLLKNRGEILERLRVAGAYHAVWLRAKRFKTVLTEDPGNAEARDKLIKLCLIELDQRPHGSRQAGDEGGVAQLQPQAPFQTVAIPSPGRIPVLENSCDALPGQLQGPAGTTEPGQGVERVESLADIVGHEVPQRTADLLAVERQGQRTAVRKERGPGMLVDARLV